MTSLINVARVAVSEESTAVATSASSAIADSKAIEIFDRSESSSSPLRQSYYELGLPTGAVNAYRNGSHVVEMDVLEQLKSNLAQLEEMHSRLKFMMSEVRYLVISE